MEEDQFNCVEKIKTTGYTYMAASGLTASTVDMTNYSHVTRLADFALRLKDQLDYVNIHSFNNFKIRVGKLLSMNLNLFYLFLFRFFKVWFDTNRDAKFILVYERHYF